MCGPVVKVNTELNLAECCDCGESSIDVEHEIFYEYGGAAKAIVINVTCEHYKACERATLLRERKRLEAMQDDRR